MTISISMDLIEGKQQRAQRAIEELAETAKAVADENLVRLDVLRDELEVRSQECAMLRKRLAELEAFIAGPKQSDDVIADVAEHG